MLHVVLEAYKESGFGREGGSEGIRSYTVKLIYHRLIKRKRINTRKLILNYLLILIELLSYILEENKKDQMVDIHFHFNGINNSFYM